MGKLFDSMKQRGATLPAASSIASASRLQIVPAISDLPGVDDHEPMPFYEVPNDNEQHLTNRAFSTAPSLTIQEPKSHPVENLAIRQQTDSQPSGRFTFTATEQRHSTALKHIADELVVVHQPDSAASLEYRSLAEQLIQELTSLQAQSMTLLPWRQESAATLAANLGCAWAEITRHPLVLIDAARSNPGDDVACLFGLTNAPGWEELMTGSAVGEALQQTGRVWLDLIGSGRRLVWSNTQSWAQKASQVIQSLGKHYRHIILLGPAFPQSPLGLVLAETTASTCMVVARDDKEQSQREAVLLTLAQQGKPVIGTILLDG